MTNAPTRGPIVAAALAMLVIVAPAPLAFGQCNLTCPANITVSNALNQCGRVVTFSGPTTSGTCGTVMSMPASGTFFTVGKTTS